MNGPIDYTGYGYSSGGFAPTPADSAAARRNKAQMDRMSDYMQKLDPVLNKTLETLVRTQIRNGATPEEARRAAFGSAQGQLLSDTMLGLRKTGFLGQGNPIDYGRNVLQGVAGGGFSVDILAANGRAQGMGQSVMGGGILSGTASMQMAKDLMTQLYGAGGSDPRQAYGHNMEQASMVFRKLAERGALGNIGTLKQYGDGDRTLRTGKFSAGAVDEKIANARRQEVDKEILAALDGVNSDNIGTKIKEYRKKGDEQIARALEDIESGDSTFVLNDANTKRVADITKETLKGLSNLKEIYGDLNNPQLLAKMEALTGIRITNQAEARKAANMTRQLTNTAEATGNDPAGVINAVMNRLGVTQQRVAQTFGEELGEGGTRSATGKRIAASMANASMQDALRAEASSRDEAARLNAMGVGGRALSKEEILADNAEQQQVWAEQNKALSLASGLAATTFKNDIGFTSAYRKAMSAARDAPDEMARAEANAMMERMIQQKLGKSSEAYLQTRQGSEALANANFGELSEVANIASAAAARTDFSDKIMQDAGLTGREVKAASTAFRSRLGSSGLERLGRVGKDGLMVKRSKDEIDAEIKKLVEQGVLSEEQAAAVAKNMEAVSDKEFRDQFTDVRQASGASRSFYDTEIAQAEADSRTNRQQREIYSEDKTLSLKSIANAILSNPKDGGLNTDTKRLYALEAMQKNGLAQDLAPVTRGVNMDDGLDQEEMDKIRQSAGGDLSIHTQLGYESEEAMLADQKGGYNAVTRRIRSELEASQKLIMGGSSDDMFFANADQDEKIKEYAKRFELASKYGALAGAEAGAVTPALEEIMKTGKVRPGGLGLEFKTDGYQKVYDNDGDSGFWNWNDEETNPEDKVHFSQAAKLAGLAARVNSEEEGADMIELNNLGGGGLLKALEEQLKQYEDAQSRGAKIIDTNDGKKDIRQDMGESIQQLKDAIERLKSDDGKSGEKATEHMTVTNLYVDGVLPRKG